MLDQVRNQVGTQVGNQVLNQVGKSVGNQVGNRVRTQVWNQVGTQVLNQVGKSVGTQVRNQVWDQVGNQVWKSVLGQHDSGWISFYDFFRLIGVECTSRLHGLSEVAKSSGWWWPFERACVLTERPNLLARDVDHRLHSETGPALRYPDGWSIYAWHGTRIPSEWIEHRDDVDVSLALTWENIEQRRCLAEILGWDRVLQQLQPTVIDRDIDPQIGELLRVDLPDSPKERFLRVKCGTGRQFVLPVPPEMRSARQANAWTYGIEPKEFQPEIRT